MKKGHRSLKEFWDNSSIKIIEKMIKTEIQESMLMCLIDLKNKNRKRKHFLTIKCYMINAEGMMKF